MDFVFLKPMDSINIDLNISTFMLGPYTAKVFRSNPAYKREFTGH